MKQYFITSNGDKRGPYVLSQIQSMWNSGTITADSLYWSEGMAGAMPILELIGSGDAAETSTSKGSTDSKGESPSGEVKFACGNCGQHIAASLEQVGFTVVCPGCGQEVIVPRVQTDPEPPPILPSPTPISTAASPKKEGRDEFGILFADINSRADALKVVRITGICYLVIGAINVIIGERGSFLYLDAVIPMVCGILIWWRHSRAAAITLLAILTVGIIFGIIDDGWQKTLFSPSGYINMFQFILTIRAIESTAKLRKQYSNRITAMSAQ